MPREVLVATALVAGLCLLLATWHPTPAEAQDGPFYSTPEPPVPVAIARGPLLSRVYGNAPRDDEFVELENGGTETLDLSGWSLTDGESGARFPRGTLLPAGGRIVVTRNSTSYQEDTLETADFTYGRGEVTAMEGGVLQLANDGDEVLLLDSMGRLIDAYVYGEARQAGPGWSGAPAPAPGRGEVAVRGREGGALVDHDDARDWDHLRRYRLGQSSFLPAEIQTAGTTVAILSPDDGSEALLAFLGSAEDSVVVAAYTLTSAVIASALRHAVARGVDVRILLDGSPAGGVDDGALQIAADLALAGADVRWFVGGPDVVKRYRYLHAKYAVVDMSRVLIGSENFGDAGYPPSPGQSGNRGWSIIVEDKVLALQLGEVFDEDFDPRRRDTRPADAFRGQAPSMAPLVLPWSYDREENLRPARLVVGPDMTLDPNALLGMIGSARDTLWIEAFYVEDDWGGRPNPFLEAAFDAARRSVRVRILLDGSSWSTAESSDGNDDLAQRIHTRAAREGLDIQAKLVSPAGPIERVHNKGVLVDSRLVFVGSMNWAKASATENREIGLILEDPIVAARFERALQADWDGTWRREDPLHLDDPAALYLIYVIVSVAALLTLRNLRGSRKGLSDGGWMGGRGARRSRRRRDHLRRRP